MHSRDSEEREERPSPAWYDAAKLGAFVHWGPYSVPGWAAASDDIQQIIANQGPRHYFVHNPYAEWYVNTVRIEGSPTWKHHRQTYGETLSYSHFGARFNHQAAEFDVSTWTEIFARAHARYVVLTAKHMDGFTLWPSEHARRSQDPDENSIWGTARDWVGEVSEAVREAGMRMGL